MGWVLTASGSPAGPPELVERAALRLLQPGPNRLGRAAVVDPETGADLRLTARPAGGIQASIAGNDVEVRKVALPNGDFHVRIAGRQDLVVLVKSGEALRVSRGGHTAVVQLTRSDEDGLDLVQQVLAGSRAVRAFRALHRRLGAESLESAPGVSLDLLDALLGILMGEPGAVDRRAPARLGAAWRAAFAPAGTGPSCFSEYEAEVLAAWDDFAQCVDDVKWYPGVQEVCAFVWLLKIESAWFRFIGCSSIPLKVT